MISDAGFLVLADISGFTAFTTATELEHGADVIGTLLAQVIDALSPPLEIQELEGDAVFALGSEHTLPADAPVLRALRGAYRAFRERQRELEDDTSCGCGACRSVHLLSLKLVVHHGRFVRQLVAGRSRVGGPDVILAHRLLKNDVEARAYILLTEAAMDHLTRDVVGDGAQSRTASYAYFGDVTCFVVTLESVERDAVVAGVAA